MKVINYSKIIRGEFHMKPSSTRLFLIFNLIFICLLFISPHHAIAQVYYCADDNSTGFNFDEKVKKYFNANFPTSHFKIKLDSSYKSIIMKRINESGDFTCKTFFPKLRPELLFCQKDFEIFNFNTINGRYVYSVASGYIEGDGDSILISYGTCDEF